MPDLAKVGPVGRGALQADFCILVTSPMLFKIYIIFLVIDPSCIKYSLYVPMSHYAYLFVSTYLVFIHVPVSFKGF